MTAPKSEVRVWYALEWEIYPSNDTIDDVAIVKKSDHDQEVQALKEESADKDKRIAELQDKVFKLESKIIFNKTNDNKRVELLEKALRDIAEHNTLNGNKYNNHVAAYEGVVEFAAKALSRKEV